MFLLTRNHGMARLIVTLTCIVGLIFSLLLLSFPQRVHAGCEDNPYCDSCGELCCSCRMPPICTVNCDGEDEDSPDPPPEPWRIQGSKVIYQDSGPVSSIRNSEIKIETTDQAYRTTTTGNVDDTYSINKLSRVSNGNQIDILDREIVTSVTPPASNWGVFATYCRNRTNCHTDTDTRFVSPQTIDLDSGGGYLDLFWHFVGPPTNLQVNCNASGTQARLSWSTGSSIADIWLVVNNISNGESVTCDSPNGPGDLCRTIVGTNSLTINVTPQHQYVWWMNRMDFGNTLASGPTFRCTPAPTARIVIEEPNCSNKPGTYQQNEAITFMSYPQASAGLKSSDTFIARQCNNSLCEYHNFSSPDWCESLVVYDLSLDQMVQIGNEMQFDANGNGVFCKIKTVEWESAPPNLQFYQSEWVPTSPGIYYALVNARSVDDNAFLCSGNPRCEYSTSNLTKYGSTSCTDGRFTSCQTGSTVGKVGYPENEDYWGESIRFEVVAENSCNPSAICGSVRSRANNNLGIPGVALRITAGALVRTVSTIANGNYSLDEFFNGTSYGVQPLGNTTTPQSAPDGYYPPGKTLTNTTSFTNQTLGGTPDCASNEVCDCNFSYGSCQEIDPVMSVVELTTLTSTIPFTRTSGEFDPVVLRIQQQWTGTGGPLQEVNLKIDIAETPSIVKTDIALTSQTPYQSAQSTISTITLDSDLLDEIYDALNEKNTSEFSMTVTGTRYNGPPTGPQALPYCKTTDHEAATSRTIPFTATENIVLRIHKTSNTSSCSAGTLLDSTDIAGGLLTARWNGGGFDGRSGVYSTVLVVPLGTAISANFKFTQDTFGCNTNTACTNRNQTFDPATREKNCFTTTSEVADSEGNITLYVSQLEINSWWEAVGGLTYSSQTIENPLPLLGDYPVLCPPSGPNLFDQKCAPYLVRSPDYSSTLRGGLPISGGFAVGSEGWYSERSQSTFTNQSATNVALPATGGFYSHYRNLVQSKTTINSSLSSNANTTTLPDASGFYQLGTAESNNTHQLIPNDTLVVASDKSLVFFVDGNLVIGSTSSHATPVSVQPGGFIAFIVSGTITIDPNVGTDVYKNGIMPTVDTGIGTPFPPTANLTGIFMADGSIVVRSNGVSPDKRFIGDGSFISASDIKMERKYSYAATFPYSNFLSGFTPTEVFRHRPDLVLNTPEQLKETLTQYEEKR